MIIKKRKSKFRIIWSMRKWSYDYLNWRLDTAYPNGMKYAIKHPIELLKDLWNYLSWCQKVDQDLS